MALRHGPDYCGDDHALVDDDMPALLIRLAEGPLDIVEATEEFCAYLENRYASEWLAEPDARRRTFGRYLDSAARMLALAGLATFTPLPRPGGTSPTGPFGELLSCQRPVGGGCRTPNSFPHPVSGTDLYRRAPRLPIGCG